MVKKVRKGVWTTKYGPKKFTTETDATKYELRHSLGELFCNSFMLHEANDIAEIIISNSAKVKKIIDQLRMIEILEQMEDVCRQGFESD